MISVAASRDGTRAMFRADQVTDGGHRAVQRPDVGGGPVTKLYAPTPVLNGDVFFTPVANGTRVYFIADLDTDEVFSFDRVGERRRPAMVKLNAPLTAGGDVQASFIFLNTASSATADQARERATFEVFSVAGHRRFRR